MSKLLYPSKIMRITLGTFQTFSHTIASGQQYAIDEAGTDSSASCKFIAPCDVKVIRIDSSWNCYYFQSIEKIEFIDGSKDYLIIKLGHQNYKKFKVGDTIKKGSFLYQEGTAGNATGNHIHMETIKGTLATAGNMGNISPDQVFYIDETIKVIDMKNLNFIKLQNKQTEAQKMGFDEFDYVFTKIKRATREHLGKKYNRVDVVKPETGLRYYDELESVGTGKNKSGKTASKYLCGQVLDNCRYAGRANGFACHAVLNDAGTREVFIAYDER